MSLTPSDINQILAALQNSEWDEGTVEIGDVRITVSRGGAPLSVLKGAEGATRQLEHPPRNESDVPDEADGPAQLLARVDEPISTEGITVVTSPSVGLFWRSPDPGAPPFTSEGADVKEGDILCIIEIMKLMMNVTSAVSGTVTRFHLENGSAVEFGSPLMSIQSNEK